MMELSDFIAAVQADGGRVIMPSGNKYMMRHGEDPASYYMRVMEAENARKTMQEVTTPSQDGSRAEDGSGEGGHEQPRRDVASARSVPQDVSKGQASLRETLESQVSFLRGSVETWERAAASAARDLSNAKHNLKEAKHELKLAEKCLRTVSSEVHKPSGADIHAEKSKGPKGSGRVGKPKRAVRPSPEGQGSNEEST